MTPNSRASGAGPGRRSAPFVYRLSDAGLDPGAA
jgi:hypothetical protein